MRQLVLLLTAEWFSFLFCWLGTNDCLARKYRAVITPDDHKMSVCWLPGQQTVPHMYSTSDLRVQPDRFVPCFLLMSLFCRAVKDIDVWVLPGPQWGSFIILSSSVVGRHWQTMRGLVAPRLFWLVKLGDNNVYMKVSFFFFFLSFFFLNAWVCSIKAHTTPQQQACCSDPE